MLKINKIVRAAVSLLMIAALCFAFYEVGERVGESRAKVEIVEKQVEVIKYVEKKKDAIRARPNAGRNQLLQQFKTGVL